MLVTFGGIVTDVKAEHPWKARFSMLVTPLGMVTEVKPLFPKAEHPMDVTLLGMSMDVRPLQPTNT